MNRYEIKRQQLFKNQESELAQLDINRSSMSECDYWKEVSEIHLRYSNMMAEVDAEQRAKASIIASKEHTNIDKRPESSYETVLGQLKAKKEAELIAKLANCESANIHRAANLHVDIKDPFYLDKKDPLGVFNRWWVEMLQSLPSLAEVQLFLRKVDISESGCIYIREDVEEGSNFTNVSSSTIEDAKSCNLDSIITSRQHKRMEKEARQRKERLRRPLLNKLRCKKSLKPNVTTESALITVVDAYNLPDHTCDLLYDHIAKCCVTKGLTNPDEYQNMLEQFLRNVPDDKRDSVISVSIQKGWRKLYYAD